MNRISLVAERPIESEKADSGFIISIILLLGLGLVTLYASSLSSGNRVFGDPLYFIKRQLVFCILGLGCFLLFSCVNLAALRKMLPFIVIGSLLLCLLTFVPGIGEEVNGARRWIKLPFMKLQPSEIAKFAVILFLANLFAKKQDNPDTAKIPIFPAAIGLCVFVLVVFMQNDFSTAFFIMLIGALMFFIAGVPLYWFLVFFLFVMPVAVLFIFTKAYRINRLIAFLKPSFDLHGINYQMNAARRAIASGGFWGQGIGGGLRRVAGIPEVQADFIFAGWTEAMGFLGVILFFLLVGYFVFRGYCIALNCCDNFKSFSAFGMISAIALQMMINCAVVCGAVPSTGLPLPFFSAGGSSLLVTMCMCGYLINVSRNNGAMRNYYE
ncbi:MAG: putative lipid II flippase FtsW [Bacteroides sp.]|nr:putative lipid II flippase FtsW [Prevotella sp.]MCM1407441.1 putative lipid II flippase FtsW [Treponema brennaborense]MCM1469931.1 putative lipid II flippase FtsW [Bacteroides sp.]